jgi:hypothetical protein
MITSKDLILNSPLRKKVNLKDVDGKSIVNALQYQLLINLNLTLLEYDQNTNLVTLLAEDFVIKDKQIIFQIKKGVKTVSGHEIKGYDAEVSLKRLIMSSGNHSRLAELLSLGKNLDFPAISSKEYNLILTARRKSYIPFILKLLTNADNVILPTTALSSNLPNSEIINFKETSGPYFISSPITNLEVSHIKLELNPAHLFFNKDMAKEVNYIFTPYEELINKEEELDPKFNYIHNVTTLNDGQIKKLQRQDSNTKVYATAPIKNTMVFSTEQGRKKNSIDDLLYYSLKVRDVLLSSEKFLENIKQPQIQFFPKGGDGQLSNEELQLIIQKYDAILKTKPMLSKIKLGVFEASYVDYKNLFEKLENIEIVPLKTSPFEKNIEGVDIFIDTVDSSFMETLDLLEFNKSLGIFNVSDNEMKEYIDSEDKDKRIDLLRKIHLKSLLEARFVNIVAAPYFTVVSKKWVANPPTYFVGFPVWKIKIKSF